jgi:hypothetical protein
MRLFQAQLMGSLCAACAPAGTTQQEPYTAAGQPREYCGVANFTQSYSTLWGWANSFCDNTLISICRIRRELARSQAALPAGFGSSWAAGSPLCVMSPYTYSWGLPIVLSMWLVLIALGGRAGA